MNECLLPGDRITLALPVGEAVGLTAGHFMQRTRLMIIACTLLAAAPFLGGAVPASGCADPTPAATWWGAWSDGGDREFWLGDGLT